MVINSKEIVKMTLDAVTLLGLAHSKLNNQQKSAISPSLQYEVRDVCSAWHEVTDYLFGDDLSKAIKEAKELNKISNQFQRKATAYPSKYQAMGSPQQNPPSRSTSSNKQFFRQARKSPFRKKKPYKN